MKKFIFSQSPHRNSTKIAHQNLKFLEKYHKIAHVLNNKDANYNIFIYRDPLDRLISLYLNKFIVKSLENDVAKLFESTFNTPAKLATFEDFIMKFSKIAKIEKNGHFHSHYDTLGRFNYNAVIEFKQIKADFLMIMPDKYVEKYFSSPINKSDFSASTLSDSTDPFLKFGSDVGAVPAEELRQCFAIHGKTPPRDRFASPARADRVREIYAVDYALSERLEKAEI